MELHGKLVMFGFHLVGIAFCGLLYWLGGGWLLGPWLGLGVGSLAVYIQTWTDTPAIWWWPYLIMCWPIMWLGGLVHPIG